MSDALADALTRGGAFAERVRALMAEKPSFRFKLDGDKLRAPATGDAAWDRRMAELLGEIETRAALDRVPPIGMDRLEAALKQAAEDRRSAAESSPVHIIPPTRYRAGESRRGEESPAPSGSDPK
jgi:hypothetical protein